MFFCSSVVLEGLLGFERDDFLDFLVKVLVEVVLACALFMSLSGNTWMSKKYHVMLNSHFMKYSPDSKILARVPR